MRYGHIDALRAISALMVVWIHSVAHFTDTNEFIAKRGDLMSFFGGISPSTVGVIIFFAISGYLIPNSLKGNLFPGSKNFLISRFLRLYPLYWANILFYTMASVIFLGKSPLPLAKLPAYLTMLPSLFGEAPIIPCWTLEIELLFYGLCLCAFCLKLIHKISFLTFATAFFFILFVLGTFTLLIGKKDVLFSYEKRTLFLQLSVIFWGGLMEKISRKGCRKFLR